MSTNTFSPALPYHFYGQLVTLPGDSSPNLHVPQEVLNSTHRHDRTYAHLGERIYRICYHPDVPSWGIGLTTAQAEDLCGQSLAKIGTCAAAFYPLDGQPTYRITKLTLSLTNLSHAVDTVSQRYWVELKSVIEAFKTCYADQYLCRQQGISFPWEHRHLQGTIKDFEIVATHDANSTATQEGRFAQVCTETSLLVESALPSIALIHVEPPTTLALPCAEFHVTLKEHTAQPHQTYTLKEAELRFKLDEYFKDKPLHTHAEVTFTIPHPTADHLDIKIFVHQFIDKESVRQLTIKQTGEQKVAPSIVFDAQVQCKFVNKSSNLLIIQENVNDAASIHLKVLQIHRHILSQVSTRLPCFSVEDIKETFLSSTVCRDAKYVKALVDDRGRGHSLVMQVMKGCSGSESEWVCADSVPLPQWRITEQTQLRVTWGGSSMSPLFVATKVARAADKILFHVEPIDAADVFKDHLVVVESDCVRMIRRDILRTAIGETFVLKNTQMQSYRLRVKSIQWRNDGLDKLPKKRTEPKMLASIDGGTAIELQVSKNMRIERDLLSQECGGDIRAIFKSLGIGALKDELVEHLKILKKVLVTDRGEAKRLGIVAQNLLLHGPTGTGKTEAAKAIAKFLGVAEQNYKFLGATELLNKWVGATEESIRDLFQAAEKDYKELGEASPLHALVMDEIDTVFGNRSSRSTGHNNSYVGQLLTSIDRAREKSPNLLIIAMTNHRELIDAAVIREGRFGAHLEIGLPTVEGRAEIFQIHTTEARKIGKVAPSIDWQTLAKQCPEFTGAAIADVVKTTLAKALGWPAGQQLQQSDFEATLASQRKKRKADDDLSPAVALNLYS